MLTTVADLTLGLAVKQRVGPAVTVDLHARFLGPAAIGDWIEGRGRVDTAGQNVVHASCVLVAGGEGGREIVRASGVYAAR